MATRSQTPYLKRLSAWVGYAFDHHFIIFFFLTIALLVINELLRYGPNVFEWDPLFMSGWITLVVGIRLARNLPNKVDETINRLVHRGSLELELTRLPAVKRDLEALTDSWIRWSGIINVSSG